MLLRSYDGSVFQNSTVFQPSFIGEKASGIQDLFHSIMKCNVDIRENLCSAVVLTGFDTCDQFGSDLRRMEQESGTYMFMAWDDTGQGRLLIFSGCTQGVWCRR